LPYTIEILPKAGEDCLYWLKHDRNKFRKIIQLLKAILEAPFEGIGEPEALRHDLHGFWSRRIDLRHRILYRVESNKVFIHRCYGHYD
jgi:toxin YoeB